MSLGGTHYKAEREKHRQIKAYYASLRRPWLEQLHLLVAAGAGEVVLNAVDRDGMMEGMDLDLIQEASRAVSVPLIALGGVGSVVHIKEAIAAGASAVAAGAFFVFQGPHRAVLITYPRPEDVASLLSAQ